MAIWVSLGSFGGFGQFMQQILQFRTVAHTRMRFQIDLWEINQKIIVMKCFAQKIILPISFFCFIIGCKKNETTAQQNSTTSRSLTGKVTDARGVPLPSASVVMEHTVWLNNFLLATSNTQGNYSINMPTDPAGSWTAKATLTKNAFGETYRFDLHPHSTTSFTTGADVTRNFTWKLSGPRPGGGFYGAHVDVYAMGTNVPLNEVKLVFTPFPGENTLIDGTPNTSFERNLEDVAGTFMANDIPIGKYEVRAMHSGRTLLLDYRHNSGDPQVSKTVVFGKHGFLADTEYNITFWLSE